MATSYFMLKMLTTKRRKNKLRRACEDESVTVSTNHFIDLPKCRVCLKAGNIPIFGSEETSDISDVVRFFGDIEIDEKDDYPKHLCDACYSLLKGAILFRKSAKESEEILQNSAAPVELTTEIDLPDISDNENNIYENQSETKIYKCKLCKLKFDTFTKYVKHKNSKQHKNVRIQCNICQRLLTATLYKRHLVRHQSASHLICDICGKLYRKDNLVRHLQLHNFDLPYQCQVCPYRGRFMESLKIHMRTHTGDKPFSCDKCELRFLTRSNLNRHLLTHKKDRPFKCMECSRGFYTKRDMDVHIKADHAGIKDYGCRVCGNKYGTRKALMRHELRVHKRDKMAKGRVPLYLQAEYRKNNTE